MDNAYTNELINIPSIQNDCNFWMIRTNDGLFYDEFINNEFIAIGWNCVRKHTFPIDKKQREFLEKEIKEKYNTNIPGMAINKCEKFCNSLKDGDIAIISGKSSIAFAIIGEFYEESPETFTEEYELAFNEKLKDNNFHETIKCPYCKRRKITLISVINNREEINPYLYKALLLNKHSLSSLNQYADTILSSCYDIYFWNGTLSLAFRVQKKTNIGALSLTEFINSFATLLQVEDENLSVKTAIHSPGDIILQIQNAIPDLNQMMWVFISVIFLFGGKVGNIELPSLFNVAKYFIDKHANKELNDLNKEKLRLENKKLEQEIESLKLDNNKKARMESAAESLSKAVNTLELKPINNKIIKLENIQIKSKDSDS